MIKVGVSCNVRKRRSLLAEASPERLSILKIIKPGKALAFHIESGVKILLRRFRIRDEWFKCSDTLALLALHAAEHGELECRSRLAMEIKRQKPRMLDAETVAALILSKGKQDAIFFDRDLTGFGLRLRHGSGGKLLRSYVVQYRRAGKSRRMGIGNADLISAEQAREAARKVLVEVALGGDPQGEKRAARKLTHRRAALRKAAKLPAKVIARQLLAQVVLGGDLGDRQRRTGPSSQRGKTRVGTC